MAYIKDWHQLTVLNPDFSLMVRNIFVFDTNAIFIITNSDNVYSFGPNDNGCLGLGHNNAVNEPQIIKELYLKRVVSIKFGIGSSNVLALTKNGHIYTWGGNVYGQLANGNTNSCFTPKIIESIIGLKVIAINCASCHCLALTYDGRVFGWGYNGDGRLGIGNTNSPILKPTQLKSLIDYKIIAIECGGGYSLVLTENGIVFSFGYNGNGQLGIGNTTDANIPTKLDMNNDIVISKIICGSDHSLLLSMNGEVYSFGNNQFGQIGDRSNTHRNTPIKLILPLKCVDIVAINSGNISIGKMENGLCYVWGQCVDKTILSPTVTKYEHINDVIINFSKYKWNYEQIRIELNSIISTRFIDSFNIEKYSDISFKVEDKRIYVQKPYLISVCKHFESMFSENNWNENSGNEVNITQYSYPVYHAFLKYLYSGLVDIETEYVFDLLDLANSYFEDELKLKCAQIIKFEINCENVCSFYSSAVKFDLNELKVCCFEFALKNFDIIKQTDGYQQTEDVSFLKAILEKVKL